MDQNEQISAEEVEQEMLSLEQLAPQLPSVLGFSPEHRSINQQLIDRILMHLRGAVTADTYGIRETSWGTVEETLTVRITENIVLKIELSTKK